MKLLGQSLSQYSDIHRSEETGSDRALNLGLYLPVLALKWTDWLTADRQTDRQTDEILSNDILYKYAVNVWTQYAVQVVQIYWI
jgi:hypothetical protein